MEIYLRVNLLGPGPRLIKKRIYRAAISQRLGNTGLGDSKTRNCKASSTEVAEDVDDITRGVT
jgi:hypothetical protein